MHYLCLDIETAPIGNAADFLPVGDITAPSNYKDEQKIADYIAAKRLELIADAALDMDLARIVTVGMWTREAEVIVHSLTNEDDERIVLAHLASMLKRPSVNGDDAMLITFNGHRYDLPLIMRRARYLGVPFPELNLDRYKSPHIDLYDLLTMRGAIKSHGLRWYFRRLGYSDLLAADPLEQGGGDVCAAITEGRWEDVAQHCRCDVEGTVRLARWLGVLPAEAEAF